jgi:hypothetical protein
MATSATRINPHRFDRRRAREARALLETLSPDEKHVMALVMRHTVSGRFTRSRGATAIAVTASGRKGSRILEVRDLSQAITNLVVMGWLRFVPILDGRGNFWRTDAAESITNAACVSAPDLDPSVPV